jgi:RNA polymerase sigma factor (sigma-70 family)
MKRDLERISEEYLTILAQQGDREAFAQLAKRLHPRLIGYARTLFQNSEEAADAVQETWLVIQRKLPCLKDPAVLRAWAFRILNARSIDRYRASQRRTRYEAQAAVSYETEEAPTSSPKAEELAILIKGLPPEKRALIDLVYRQECSLQEVSVALKLPLGTVKSRLFHLRETLKKRIQNND